jgi:chromosome segregation ATPase
MNDTQVSKLFIVELHTKGWGAGFSHTPEERVLTTFFRLSNKQKNTLHYLKVRFYRIVDRHSVFELGDKYVVPQRKLVIIEKEFQEIYREFKKLREEFYNDIMKNWKTIEKRIRKFAKRVGASETRIERLKPDDENFLEMYYTVTPLSDLINQIYRTSEDFERLSQQVAEYKNLAKRVREEADRMINEMREKYNDKIKELNDTIEKLKDALKKKSKEAYVLRLKAKAISEDAMDVANLLGEETVDDLKEKLQALQEYFVDTQVSSDKK